MVLVQDGLDDVDWALGGHPRRAIEYYLTLRRVSYEVSDDLEINHHLAQGRRVLAFLAPEAADWMDDSHPLARLHGTDTWGLYAAGPGLVERFGRSGDRGGSGESVAADTSDRSVGSGGTEDSRKAVASSRSTANEPETSERALSTQMRTGTIRTASDALARAQQRWPYWLEVADHSVKLVPYRQLAQWYAGYDDPTATELYWVVGLMPVEAMATPTAPGSDGISDNSEAYPGPSERLGQYFTFRACNGEPKVSGGLGPDQFATLGELVEADPRNIISCPPTEFHRPEANPVEGTPVHGTPTPPS